MRLEPASPIPPRGLEQLLADLADGENGFMGTPVHSGEATLGEYLRQCCDQSGANSLPEGWVPQTVFWMLDEGDQAVGMVRMRHCLNDALRVSGGHIGFYVRKDRRGRGYASQGIRLALAELQRLGEPRALLTVNADNPASIHVIESVGGCPEQADRGGDSGMKRYWIELPASAQRA